MKSEQIEHREQRTVWTLRFSEIVEHGEQCEHFTVKFTVTNLYISSVFLKRIFHIWYFHTAEAFGMHIFRTNQKNEE